MGPPRDTNPMNQMYQTPQRTTGYLMKSTRGRSYIDYKKADDLRRLMTPNGKVYSRKRTGVSSWEQRMIAQAIKRARYMALLPYTSATL